MNVLLKSFFPNIPEKNKSKERVLYRIKILLFSLMLLVGIVIISLIVGTINFSLKDIFNVLLRQSTNDLAHQIIFNVRLPRILTGVLTGVSLAVAGSILQAILRNPMAAPNVIGVNAGAGLGAIFIMVLLPSRINLIPVAAFLGALITSLMVYLLSKSSKGQGSSVHIILAGVALSSLLTAIANGLMMLNRDELEVTYTWLLGSLSGRGWSSFYLLLPYTILGVIIVLLICPKLNIFILGDNIGSSIGINIEVFRMIFILLSAFLAGSAVSVSGTIGFIGLIAPHISRMLVGNDYKYVIPLSGLLGASILVGADTMARTIFSPFEMPVGVVTAILGAPFFLYLLYRKNKI